MSMRLLLVLAAPLLALGCLAYNEECASPSDLTEPDRIVGWVARDLVVDEQVVRRGQAPIGDIIADAYAYAFNNPLEDPSVNVDGAWENAGGIRDEGFCSKIEAIEGPQVTRLDLREVMPFSNRVVAVELTPEQIDDVLEHAVGTLDADNPRGFFLQVSSAFSFVVDCSGAPEQVSGETRVPGSRVAIETILLGGQPVTSRPTWRIAMNNFIQAGNDDFLALRPTTPMNSRSLESRDLVEAYLTAHSTEDDPYRPEAPGTRIQLVNCD